MAKTKTLDQLRAEKEQAEQKDIGIETANKKPGNVGKL